MAKMAAPGLGSRVEALWSQSLTDLEASAAQGSAEGSTEGGDTAPSKAALSKAVVSFAAEAKAPPKKMPSKEEAAEAAAAVTALGEKAKRQSGAGPADGGADSAAAAEVAGLADAILAGGLEKTTSGIGGSFSPAAAAEAQEEVHKPSTSGSWGVFERPKDISKAYGGGKRVGVGGVKEDPAEAARKAAETAAILAKFRKGNGSVAPSKERERSEEINAALEKARVSMAKGYCDEAVGYLEPVAGFLSFGTILGGTVFVEYAMALEASGDREKALGIYKKVASQNSDEAVRRQAKQLMFGFEAMDFFKVEPVGSEATKLAQSTSMLGGKAQAPVISEKAWAGEYTNKGAFNLNYVNLTPETRRRLALDNTYFGNFTEARDLLLRAATFRGRGRDIVLPAVRVRAACRFLHALGRGGENGTADAALLEGAWRLALTVKGADGEIAYLPLGKMKGAQQQQKQKQSPPPDRGFTRSFQAPAAAAGAAGAAGFSAEKAGGWPGGWLVPRSSVSLPLGARGEASGRLNGWPVNAKQGASAGTGGLEESFEWELSVELTGGSVGPGLPLLAVPQPARSAVLALDASLMVTASLANPKAPTFEVWIRD